MVFDIDATVDYLFASETDAEFLKRFKDSFIQKGEYKIPEEQIVAVHKSERGGVSVARRVREAILSFTV